MRYIRYTSEYQSIYLVSQIRPEVVRLSIFSTKGAKEKSQKLIKDGRVNFTAPGDYREGRLIDLIIKAWIDKTSFNENLENLSSL